MNTEKFDYHHDIISTLLSILFVQVDRKSKLFFRCVLLQRTSFVEVALKEIQPNAHEHIHFIENVLNCYVNRMKCCIQTTHAGTDKYIYLFLLHGAIYLAGIRPMCLRLKQRDKTIGDG